MSDVLGLTLRADGIGKLHELTMRVEILGDLCGCSVGVDGKGNILGIVIRYWQAWEIQGTQWTNTSIMS